MSSQLIIDNWMLQDIGECLTNGLSDDTASEIVVNKETESHGFNTISESCIQIEALFSFLLNIVFRDTLIVDSDFTNTWAEHQDYFFILREKGLLREIKFREQEEKLSEPRKIIVDKLCVTPSLSEVQRLNEESWTQNKGMHDTYMSAVIWGTAGMLSRSHIFEAPYTGHPLRSRLIEQSFWTSRSDDITKEVLSWVNSERFQFFELNKENRSIKQASIVLPPAIIEIIEESNDIYDLIPTAYELRDKYKKIRN